MELRGTSLGIAGIADDLELLWTIERFALSLMRLDCFEMLPQWSVEKVCGSWSASPQG